MPTGRRPSAARWVVMVRALAAWGSAAMSRGAVKPASTVCSFFLSGIKIVFSNRKNHWSYFHYKMHPMCALQGFDGLTTVSGVPSHTRAAKLIMIDSLTAQSEIWIGCFGREIVWLELPRA